MQEKFKLCSQIFYLLQWHPDHFRAYWCSAQRLNLRVLGAMVEGGLPGINQFAAS
jgi:hypothetical protein